MLPVRNQRRYRIFTAFLIGSTISPWCPYFDNNQVQAADLLLQPGGLAGPLEAERLLVSQSRLAFNLIDRLARPSPGRENIVVSPASLVAVMAAIDLGANTEMRGAIRRTIGFASLPLRNTPTDLQRL